MHRLGLSETVLVFPEHRAFLGKEPFVGLVERLKRAAPEKRLVIEVNTLEAAIVAASVGFDVIQAEKFTPDQIAAACRTDGNVRAFAFRSSRLPGAFTQEMSQPTRRQGPTLW